VAVPSNFILRHYDKVILAVAVLLLAGAIANLFLARSSAAEERVAFRHRLDGMRPKHAEASPVDFSPYEITLARLAKPYQAGISSNNATGFLSPEARIWCVECKKPIPFLSETCVFCGFEQPKPPEADPLFDSDGGGIPDAAEEKYGLDKYNPRDDTMDSDGDGFSNLDEYLAGTDPMDASSHPDFASALRVRSIQGHKLPMRLRGKMMGPDGAYRCQINVQVDGEIQSPWVKIGGEVGKTGFKLAGFEALSEKRADEKFGGMEREIDVSCATLEREGRKVVLVMNEEATCTDYDITLVFTLDGTEIKTSNECTFKLRDRLYCVSGVDIDRQSVVIFDETDGNEVTIPSE
jgi:hypothetical protein